MKKFFETLEVISLNREPAHSPRIACSSRSEALNATIAEGTLRINLNGDWKFLLTMNPNFSPAGFEQPEFDDSGWRDLPVPSNWQLFEESDPPIYTNIYYPFEGHPTEPFAADPPHLPSHNPTGYYRRFFDIPSEWAEKRLFIVIESADSNCSVWVNGCFVGYSEDSRLPAEFEITEFAQGGVNCVAVEVQRYCTGSYLEDQDYWHMSGLQRGVSVYAKPMVFLRDLKVQTLFDPDIVDSDLVVMAYLSETNYPENYSVRAELFDSAGAPVFDEPLTSIFCNFPQMYEAKDSLLERRSARLSRKIKSPNKWSAEFPNLYTLLLTLYDPDGWEIDWLKSKVGFRHLEINNRELQLNGERLIVRGVNRHEHHPVRGRALTDEDMIADIVLMKRLNFNAVRTSHYPNSSRWYELCDEYGIYVIDETNLETHRVGGSLSKDPAWSQAYLTRLVRMVLRDKNHPSIIAWSLGNESLYGPHHSAMAAWARQYDTTRPVQYESGNPPASVSDIMVPMYPTLNWIIEVMNDSSETRPMILCEYAYAKGNAGGGVMDIWNLVDQYPAFQGGFVWDWADKPLEFKRSDGQTALGYGGDLGCGTNYAGMKGEDPTQVLNGIVSADLSIHPGAYEIKYAQAPVRFEATDKIRTGELTVWNRYQFDDLSGHVVAWTVTKGGEIIGSGSLPAPVTDPGARSTFHLPISQLSLSSGSNEYWLTVSCQLAKATQWAEAGHEITSQQFSLVPLQKFKTASVLALEREIETIENDHVLTVGHGNFSVTFDKANGTITHLSRGAQSLPIIGPVDNFYRPPTDNDYALNCLGNYASLWKAAGIDRLNRGVSSFSFERMAPGTVLVVVKSLYSGASPNDTISVTTSYEVLRSGCILVKAEVTIAPDLPVVARVGAELTLFSPFDTVTWYGAGPHESYPDRKKSTHIGQFSGKIDDQFYPFILPGESGGKEDVRWAQISNSSGGPAIAIFGRPVVHLDVSHYQIADIADARHNFELVAQPETLVHIDGFHMGLGGRDGWSPNVPTEFLLTPGTYTYSYGICPLEKADTERARDIWLGL